MRAEEPLDRRGVSFDDRLPEAGGQVGRQGGTERLQGPDHPIDIRRERLTFDRRGPAVPNLCRPGQRGREGREAAADGPGRRRQVADKGGIPRVAAGRVAQPGGLRRDRLVERPERGDQRLRRGAHASHYRLGVGPRAGPGAVAVAIEVGRVGEPEHARRPDSRRRLVGPCDGPVRRRHAGTGGDRNQGDIVGRPGKRPGSPRLQGTGRADRSGPRGPSPRWRRVPPDRRSPTMGPEPRPRPGPSRRASSPGPPRRSDRRRSSASAAPG